MRLRPAVIPTCLRSSLGCRTNRGQLRSARPGLPIPAGRPLRDRHARCASSSHQFDACHLTNLDRCA